MNGPTATGDITLPDAAGAARAMRGALLDSGLEPTQVDYINAHGTSTPAGDVAETLAVKGAFGEHARSLAISSTKSLSGHSLGAAGVHEANYCLLMMQGNFIAGSANIEELDAEVADMPIVRETREDAKIDTVMSNSFGFGGTNATLVLKRWKG